MSYTCYEILCVPLVLLLFLPLPTNRGVPTIVHGLHVNPPHQSFGGVVRCMRNSTHLHTYRAAAQMASSAELERGVCPHYTYK